MSAVESGPKSWCLLLFPGLPSVPKPLFGGSQKGGFQTGGFWRMFPQNENRNEGTFAKTTLLRNRPFISQWACLVLTKGWFSAGVPPERKPERGDVRQNHPFTKPPYYLPVNYGMNLFHFLRLHCKITLRPHESIHPEAQVAKNYSTDIIQIPCKNHGVQK